MRRRDFLKTAAAAALTAASGVQISFAAAAGGVADDHPLLAPWGGPHGGIPPFDKIKKEDFQPALMRAMELHSTQIKAIAENAETPTFDNTLKAMEDAGRELTRAATIFFIYTSTMNDKTMQKIEQEMTPKLAAHQDEIIQNEKLFARIKTLYDARENSGLTPEQQRLAYVYYNNFARQGANLNPEQKKRLAEINQELAGLYTKFSQNVLADEENYSLVIDNEADLSGLPDALKASAAQAAEEKGQKGKWLFANTRSSIEPFLTYADNRALREKGWRMWISRGENQNDNNNIATANKILTLRAEKAKLLGFASHAHWVTDDGMAKTPDAALALMMKVWKPAVARVGEEVAEMQAIADKEGAGITIEPWDYRYYAEKVRTAKYAIDQTEVSQYLQLDKLREAMFWASGELYNMQYTKINDAPTYHPDMSVYEVTRDGKRLSLWYFDPYARAGKQSGAWMNEYRTQERFASEVTPIVSNNCNFVKAAPGEAVLVSWDDATTMFHEFGHALHGMNSNVTYPSLAGTNTKRDFVEFPSQINEHWFPTKEVLNRFALHHKTGQPIPAELTAKIEAAKHFNQGFQTVEYMAAALYDMKIHLDSANKAVDIGDYEKSCMAEIGMPKEIVMRHRPTQFMHIFSGDGYSAGYYNYIWADALTADAWEKFEQDGEYNKQTALSFRDNILAVGNSVPPDVAFRNFRGRDVDTDALLRDRGFPAG